MRSHPPHHPAAHPERFRRRLIAALAAVLVTACLPIAFAAPSHAAVPPADHITITAAGAPAYRLDADLESGGITVTDAVGNYETSKIAGQGALPGPSGGTAAITFQITRGAFGGLSGNLTVRDPDAAVEIDATVSGNVQRPSDETVTWQGTGTVRRGTQTTRQTVAFTIQDRRPDPGDHAIRMVHAGQDRKAILRLPDDYDGTPRPVLFHFPGLYEAPWMAELFGQMADYAQTRGFIMITPEHYGAGWQGVAGGPASPDVDDPGFVTKLQDILVSRFSADPLRLYASGMSNGGFFTSKLACENKRFAAYAPVSGQLGNLAAACRPGRHIPIVMLHGDGDFIVPYASAPPAAQFWARNNGCATGTADTNLPNIDPRDNTTVVRHDYRDCPADGPVTLYEIRGGGHNWPGGIPFLGPFLGGTTYDIDANEVIWNFVSQHRLH
ncbi:alpha/beta hydrolase family esterase [Actinomadura sp. 6N118]|uniref:alpha/beta hydrolase family esterase n=1 Tax=Actinomadura sp. 6N118 TaxID=3375151 RepID=UPI0037A0465E